VKAKLLKALRVIAEKLSVSTPALAAARQQWQAEHDTAHRLHAKAKKAQALADKLRRQGHLARAARKDARAQNLARKAAAAHARAQQAVGDVKRLTARVEGLARARDHLKAQLASLKTDRGVKIKGNAASGGSRRDRLHVVALASAAACAEGHRRNFYSQAGRWDVEHCITGEAYGERSDCSSWFTSVYHSAGLADPNRNGYGGGYTGTLGTGGKSISRGALKAGDAVLYGTAPFHHVEMFTGPGDQTIGHGSPPVDRGVVNLLPGPIAFRTYL
jgi:hypothetical protein